MRRDPWDTKGGENGQVTNSVGNLLATQFLKDIPDYASQKFKDGSTAREQYDGWLAYLSRWLDERVKRGQFQEYGASYQDYTFSALVNLRDFAEDPVLRKKSEMFLDLAFASLAEETLCTQLGGPKSRSKGEDRTCKLYKVLFNAPGEPWLKMNMLITTSWQRVIITPLSRSWIWPKTSAGEATIPLRDSLLRELSSAPTS